MKINFIVGALLLFVAMFGCKDDDGQLCGSCDLEPDMGPCEAAIKKYYFNQETQTCTEFIWGGCDGVVPFDTLEECEACGCQ